MAETRRRVRRPQVAKPVAKPQVEEEDDEEFEEEEVEVKPKASKKAAAPVKKAERKARRVVVTPVVEEDDEDEEPADDEEFEEDVAADEEDESYTAVTEENPVLAMLESLRNGELITIVRVAKNTWAVSNAEVKNNKKVGRAAGLLSGAEYDAEVLNPEFVEWSEEWRQLPNEEKLKMIKKAGIKYTEYSSPSITLMHATNAYREHLGIKKHKPEYESAAARKALRTGGK